MADPVRPVDVETLIAAFEASGCAELHVRFEGFELHLSSDSDARPSAITTAAAQERPSPNATPAASASTSEPTSPAGPDLTGYEIVRAPYLGTFYRSPKPGEPPFVELGAVVDAESDLCLVEVMKLFTAVRAGVSGVVAHILASDGEMVEADRPLFAIKRER